MARSHNAGTRSGKAAPPQRVTRAIRDLKRTTKILISIVASHALLSMPGDILYILAAFGIAVEPRNDEDGDDEAFLVLTIVSHVLYVAGFSINYFLYFLANGDVRRETKTLLRSVKATAMKLFCS